ncbi:hypothetical protein GJ698_06470 [Pseudoduganella sp. FT26W]|uniref:TniQ domain-containing protein n=1 Tax=Duganella aquatilis TaxID=2666082 RepID=A0A844CSK5_9BURK|nr:hypothetical protein [Duganella aquatilis]
MIPLPRPYADEIIGSTLLRGARWLGIPPKRLAPLLRGGSTAPPSPILPSCVGHIAEAAGLSSREILYGHTVFPYVTAFMDKRKVMALERKLLGIDPMEESCFGALQTKAVVPFLRLCRQCVREDVERHGESYWHRSHLLPGVHLCLKHRASLLETNVPAKGFFKMILPQEAKSRKYRSSLRPATTMQIAQASLEILDPQHTWPRTADLRKLALEKNYIIGVYEIPALKLAADVMKFYGSPFLDEVRCSYEVHKKSPWPTLVLRASSVDLAPLKYLLMGVYLRSCRSLDSAPTREALGHQRPGPRTERAEYQELERQAMRAVQAHLKALIKAQQRTTVQALLRAAGIWERFRHNRDEFPMLAELVLQFRASDQSERQLGKRSRWRK